MPLSKGKSKSAFKGNVEELMHTYEGKGKIGNITPKDKKHAQRIALAISYKEQRGKKKKK